MYRYDEEILGSSYVREIAGKSYPISRVSGKKCSYQGTNSPTKTQILLKGNEMFLAFMDEEKFIVSSPISGIKKSRNGNFVIFTVSQEIFFLGDKTTA